MNTIYMNHEQLSLAIAIAQVMRVQFDHLNERFSAPNPESPLVFDQPMDIDQKVFGRLHHFGYVVQVDAYGDFSYFQIAPHVIEYLRRRGII